VQGLKWTMRLAQIRQCPTDQRRKFPTRELSIGLVVDERLARATGWARAS
jgi:hypothetical protein